MYVSHVHLYNSCVCQWTRLNANMYIYSAFCNNIVLGLQYTAAYKNPHSDDIHQAKLYLEKMDINNTCRRTPAPKSYDQFDNVVSRMSCLRAIPRTVRTTMPPIPQSTTRYRSSSHISGQAQHTNRINLTCDALHIHHICLTTISS